MSCVREEVVGEMFVMCHMMTLNPPLGTDIAMGERWRVVC